MFTKAGSRARFHTGNPGGWEGAGKEFPGLAKKPGFLWVRSVEWGVGVGVEQPRAQGGPSPLGTQGWGHWKACAPQPLVAGDTKARPRDYLPTSGAKG